MYIELYDNVLRGGENRNDEKIVTQLNIISTLQSIHV